MAKHDDSVDAMAFTLKTRHYHLWYDSDKWTGANGTDYEPPQAVSLTILGGIAIIGFRVLEWVIIEVMW